MDAIEALEPFNYTCMSKPGGRRSFYDSVLLSNIDTGQRIGCILDYATYLTKNLIDYAGFTETEALEQAATVVFTGLRAHQEQYGDSRTHDGIEDMDRCIKDHHALRPNEVFHAHKDPYVAKFYEIMVGMVSVPQGDK